MTETQPLNAAQLQGTQRPSTKTAGAYYCILLRDDNGTQDALDSLLLQDLIEQFIDP